MKTTTIPWSHKGADYLVTATITPGRKQSYGQPEEYPELEVINIQVDGNPGHITDDLYCTASGDDQLYQAALNQLSEDAQDAPDTD
jgi:antibiotic biosynthesis monooxygenase (ABM) superfamily enzyme